MKKPRRREKDGSEVAIPAYEAMPEKGMRAHAAGSHGKRGAVGDLLEQLVARGVDAKAKRMFVIDGAKALRAAINRVFGPQHPA